MRRGHRGYGTEHREGDRMRFLDHVSAVRTPHHALDPVLTRRQLAGRRAAA